MVDGFSGGLNTLVSPQEINDKECSILLNAQITENGVISRRQGSAEYDNSDGTQVLGLGAFTTFNATTGVPTRNLLKVDESGNLKKLNLSTKAWTTVTGFTYQAGNPVEMVMGPTTLGKMYIVDGKNPLTYTDGSTITTFSSISDPSGGLALATAGSAGNTEYDYCYTLVGNTGETKPCATVSITTGNAKLDATNYITLTITRSSDANVTGYNIYGKKTGYLFYLGSVQQSNSGNLTFNDTGLTPNTQFLAPGYNTTEGPVGSMVKVYHDTLFMAGDPKNPSRLTYSAGLDKFDSFQLIDGAGFITISLEDGDWITALEVYKDKLMVFKNRSYYMFAFGDPAPTIFVVNPAIGAASSRSVKSIINDVYFLSPLGQVYQSGYQQGYYGLNTAELVRTQELSIKIHPTLTINPARIPNACALYTVPNYKYILAYSDGSSSYNNKVAVYDTRYSAWVIWDDLNINCMINYIDPNNNELVLYGDDNEGKVIQLFTGLGDQGNAFTFRMRTKDFNAKSFQLLKTWVWPTYHFRNILGTIITTIVTDGATNQSTTYITSTTSFTGWSFDRWANILWGQTMGSSATATSADAPRQKNVRITSRSIGFLFENTSATDQFTILGLACRYILYNQRRLTGSLIIQ